MHGRVLAGLVVVLLAPLACAPAETSVRFSGQPRTVATATTDPPVPLPVRGTEPVAPAVPVQRAEPLRAGPVAARPTALRIAALDVDAPIRPVGVDRRGVLEVPPRTEVGWYRPGPVPGAAGSAVLAAHVDHGGRPGVFFDLEELAPGAIVEVALDDGTSQRFVVVAVERHAKEDLPADLFRPDGPPGLALVTCGGAFDPEDRRYLDNVVARAVPLGTGRAPG